MLFRYNDMLCFVTMPACLLSSLVGLLAISAADYLSTEKYTSTDYNLSI